MPTATTSTSRIFLPSDSLSLLSPSHSLPFPLYPPKLPSITPRSSIILDSASSKVEDIQRETLPILTPSIAPISTPATSSPPEVAALGTNGAGDATATQRSPLPTIISPQSTGHAADITPPHPTPVGRIVVSGTSGLASDIGSYPSRQRRRGGVREFLKGLFCCH